MEVSEDIENKGTLNGTGSGEIITHCLNCGTEYHGKYCPECGQTAQTKRLSMGNIVENIVKVFIKRDNKTVRTCWELIVRPGIVARNFILGQRGRYNAPMPLLVALVALYSVVVHLMPDAATPFSSFKIEVTQIVEESTEDSVGVASVPTKEVTKVMSIWDPDILDVFELDTIVMLAIQEIMGNIVYHVVLSSLLCAFPYWIVFRRRKLLRPDGQELPMNAAEHFFSLFYLACISIMFAFVSLPLNFIPGATNYLNLVLGLLPTVIGFYMYRQLLNLSWARSIWLNLVASLLTILLIAAFLCMVIFGTELFQSLTVDSNTVRDSDFHIDFSELKEMF